MTTEPACIHCGLPVPSPAPSDVTATADRRFCCHGCEAVYSAIHDLGLERFYELRTEGERPPEPGASSGRTYEEFDDAAFQEQHVEVLPDGSRRTTCYLEGLHCAACVWLIERLALVLDGVHELRVDLGRSRATIVWREPASLAEVARRLDSLGYRVHPYRGGEAERAWLREDRSLLVRLALSGAVAGNVMLIAFALYSGHFSGMASEHERLFRWASLLIATPAVIAGGGVFFRGAWAALRRGALHMDLPISLGILAGYTGGLVNTLRGAGEIYFDSVTALIFLLLVGRWFERRQRRRAADATDLLQALAPRRARRVELVDGREVIREVPSAALIRGDIVELLPGDTVPADGVVLVGQGGFDESLLTGESRPVSRGPGDDVFAGTLGLTAAVRLRVTRAGEDSRVGELMGMVETLTEKRASIVKLADRISGVFIAVVVLLAGLTAILWSVLDASRALDHTMALLVVTCPCALGLATPLAVSAALGRAAKYGILIKGGDLFERLTRPGRLWLDKTGTLTEGRLEVVRETFREDGAREAAYVRALVSEVERSSRHPIARAILAHCEGPEGSAVGRESSGQTSTTGLVATATTLEETPGAGIVGHCDGVEVRIGAPSWIEASSDLPDELERAVATATSHGRTPVAVAIDGIPALVFELEDQLRPEAKATVDQLRDQGWNVGVLSGDHPVVVAAIAKELEIPEDEARGGLTPEAKVEVVQASRGGDEATVPVVMVGDGVNDAAAMAAATVGIGIRGGAEATLAASDVYLSSGDLSQLPDLVRGAQRTFRVIRRNLLFSLAYNLLGAALAITGVIGPLTAAILMPISSLTVTISSYRSRTFEPPRSRSTVGARSQALDDPREVAEAPCL